MKRLLLMFTLTTVLATLMIVTAGYAKDLQCPNDCVDGNVDGTDDPDNIQGDDNPNVIKGYGGADEIHGGGGNDTIHGNAKHDTLYGEDGDDRLYGGNGPDTLYGGSGNDTLHGGDGNDEIYDTAAGDNDALYGEGGNDFLNAKDGDDVPFRDYLNGGGGSDQCWGEVNDSFDDSCETNSKWTPSGNLVSGTGVRYPQ